MSPFSYETLKTLDVIFIPSQAVMSNLPEQSVGDYGLWNRGTSADMQFHIYGIICCRHVRARKGVEMFADGKWESQGRMQDQIEWYI